MTNLAAETAFASDLAPIPNVPRSEAVSSREPRPGSGLRSAAAGWCSFAAVVGMLFGGMEASAAKRLAAAEGPCGCGAVQEHSIQGWQVVETANLWVCCRPELLSKEKLRETAVACERARDSIQATWAGEDAGKSWSPKCRVILQDASGYLAAVGEGGRRSSAAALVTRNGDGFERRIDVRGDLLEAGLAALPHELTHLALADRFGGRPLPRWAEEGLASQADPAAKQATYRKMLTDDHRRQRTFRLVELATLYDYPPADRWGTFYAQSASLVGHLVRRKQPADFTRFLELSMAHGYDSALKKVYDVDSLAELERQWRLAQTADEESVAQGEAAAADPRGGG